MKKILFILLFFFILLPVQTKAVVTDTEAIKLIAELRGLQAELQKYGGNTLTANLTLNRAESRPADQPLSKEELVQLKNSLGRNINDLEIALEKAKTAYAKENPNSPIPTDKPQVQNPADANEQNKKDLQKIQEKIVSEKREPTTEEKKKIIDLSTAINNYNNAKNPTTSVGNGSVSNTTGGKDSSFDKQTKKQTPCSFSFQNGKTYYCMLAPVPIFVNNTEGGYSRVEISAEGLTIFLNNLVKFALGIATALTVIMIVFGGVQYVSTDAIGDKTEGKARIQQALSGLFLALLAYVILNTINPLVFDTSLDLGETIEFEAILTPEFLRQAELDEAKNEAAANAPITTPVSEFIPPAGADISAFPGISGYVGKSYTARDNSGRVGSMIYQVAYLSAWIPSNWGNLTTISTYRSAERNAEVGGSASSDHLRGAAIDLAPRSGNEKDQAFIYDGFSVLEYLKQYGHIIGVDQIIFRDQNWRYQGGKWVQGGPVGGHYNHIHIGFQ